MKTQLIKLVTERRGEAEGYYMDNGPNKHEQEEHYEAGVAVVGMNVGLLIDWLSGQNDVGIGEDAHTPDEAWDLLTKPEQREVWEASGFHYGMMGYEKRDADFHWAT